MSKMDMTDRAVVSVGDYEITTAGYGGTATAGYGGTATAGGYGTATTGDYGIAIAGNHGTATAGDYGTATAGYYGTATAGKEGRISLIHTDGKRCREIIGYIGEDGLLPNVPYKLDEAGKFVKSVPDPILAPTDPCDGKTVEIDGKKYKLVAV